jgi:membrane peptidoglycan carboxypeptidase
VVTASIVLSPSVDDDLVTGAANVYSHFISLPPLDVPRAPAPSRLLSATGSTLATFTYADRRPVKLSQISPWVTEALIADEDRTFYTNDGIDARSIARATLNDLRGLPVQGASTITQQYVKNLIELSTNTPPPETLSRKLKEVLYAEAITHHFSKDAILDGYLNTVYFGNGAYGIQAAAQTYYSIPAKSLDLSQAATLVGILRNPTYLNPLSNPDSAKEARTRVVDSLLSTKKISPATAILVNSLPLSLHPSSPPASGCASSLAPYFCSLVWYQLLHSNLLGSSESERLTQLYEGGLSIHSTLLPTDQANAQAAAVSKISIKDPVANDVVSIQPGTGDVLAMAQNRDYGLNTSENQSEVNYATSSAPVGSTFKIFTLIAALEHHIPLTTILPGGPTYHSTTLDNPPSGYYSNADPYSFSNIDLAEATAYSVNTAFVQLEQMVGTIPIAKVARALGLDTLPLSGPDAVTKTSGSLTLGAWSFSPLQMAAAYATLAASGLYCVPRTITSVSFGDHVTVPTPPRCTQRVPASVAQSVTTLLEGVVTFGTGTAAKVPGYDIAGKTGTTQNYGAAWFDGFSSTLATSVWMGNPLGPSHPLSDVDGVSPVYGGTLPAEMFEETMSADLAGTLPTPLPTSQAALALTEPVIPDLQGTLGPAAVVQLEDMGLHVTGNIPKVVASTDPAAGTPLVPASTITLLSNS